jgi:hypothetical protein
MEICGEHHAARFAPSESVACTHSIWSWVAQNQVYLFHDRGSLFPSPGIEPRSLECTFRTLVIISTILHVQLWPIGRVAGNCGSSHCVLGSCFPFTSRDRLAWTHPCNKCPNSLQQSLKIIRNHWLNPISFMSRPGSTGAHKTREPV